MVVKKRRLDIYLPNLVIEMSRNGQEYPDGLEYGYRQEGLLIIDSLFLSIPFRNKPSLKGLDSSIRSSFPLVDPFIQQDALLATFFGDAFTNSLVNSTIFLRI